MYYIRGMFKTFKAKLQDGVVTYESHPNSIAVTLTLTKYRIRVKDSDANRLYFNFFMVQLLIDKMEYDFDKLLDKDDKKQFSIVLKQRLNPLDSGIHYLDISFWNKIKANIIHHRYFIDREKEWFIKTLIAAAVGFTFAIIGNALGYHQGYQNGIKVGQSQNPK